MEQGTDLVQKFQEKRPIVRGMRVLWKNSVEAEYKIIMHLS